MGQLSLERIYNRGGNDGILDFTTFEEALLGSFSVTSATSVTVTLSQPLSNFKGFRLEFSHTGKTTGNVTFSGVTITAQMGDTSISAGSFSHTKTSSTCSGSYSYAQILKTNSNEYYVKVDSSSASLISGTINMDVTEVTFTSNGNCTQTAFSGAIYGLK